MLLLFSGLIGLPLGAQENGLLWKIYHPKKTDTSYLFGTMHIQAEEVFLSENKILHLLEKCSTVYLEIDPFLEKNQHLSLDDLQVKKQEGIRQALGENRWKKCDSLFRLQTGFSLSLFDTYMPVYVSLLINQIQLAKRNTSGKGEIMDVYIAQQAKASKKELSGLEQAQDQLNALRKIPFREQLQLLEDELRHGSPPDIETLIQYYKEENTDSMLYLHLHNALSPKTDRLLRVNRNKKMSQQLQTICRRESAFVAVGALHLLGKEGIISHLRRKGFIVEKIPLKKTSPIKRK